MSTFDITPSQAQGYRNPFTETGSIVKAGRGSVSDTQVATRELGEIQARVLLAKQCGRDNAVSYDKIMTACQREGLASVAIYSYARGGTSINGPSIRLAEEIARDWGNIDCGWTELERNEHDSTVRAYAWDLETNAYKQITFVVPLQRTKKSGNGRITVPLTDERDIYELLANQAARRMRNCILAIVPGDIVEDAVNQCHRTLVTKCEITPERLKKMLAAFEPFGVTKAQIEKRIQRKLEAIQPAQFVRLTEIYNSLKDGMSEPGDWFEYETEEAEPAPSASEALKDALKATKRTTKREKVKTAPVTPTPEDTELDTAPNITNGDVPWDSPKEEVSLFESFTKKISETKSRAGFESIYNSVMSALSAGELSEEEGRTLLGMIDEKSAP